MKPIETHRPKVPWSWVAWMVFPWVSYNYIEMCSGAPLLFTIRKFVEDPALIGLLSSLNITFNFAVGTVISYMSDRIWTRFGRRRPFLIIGWAGLSLTLVAMPFANGVGSLVVLIVLYQLFQDIAKPYEPLYNEVIPPQQRGRAGMIRSLAQNLTGIFFNAMLIAQFDRSYDLEALGARFAITGEMVLYWTVAALVALVVLFLIFKVKETPPLHGIRHERFQLRKFLRDVFGHRQWWMVYILYACPVLATAGGSGGFSTFMPLFQAEQLHFTKQQIGWSMGAVMVLNTILIVPMAGMLADRLPRLRLFQIGLIGQAVVVFSFYVFARYVAHYDMSLVTCTAFMVANNVFLYLVYVLWGPLVYDYIPSDQFGTVSAGFSFIGGVAGFFVINASGLWVKGFTALFGTEGNGSDYSSAFIFQSMAGVAALLIALYFGRQVKRGRVRALGILELEEEQKRAAAAGSAP